MGLFRKLLRCGFYGAAAISTLLLLAALVVWPVSYYREPWLIYSPSGVPAFESYAFYCRTGRALLYVDGATLTKYAGVEFSISDLGFPDPDLATWSYRTWMKPGLRDNCATTLGMTWVHRPSMPLSESFYLAIPCSYLALLFSILPLQAFRTIRRRRKAASIGRCSKCCYDLRAHVAGARCPECGTVVKDERQKTKDKRRQQLNPKLSHL